MKNVIKFLSHISESLWNERVREFVEAYTKGYSLFLEGEFDKINIRLINLIWGEVLLEDIFDENDPRLDIVIFWKELNRRIDVRYYNTDYLPKHVVIASHVGLDTTITNMPTWFAFQPVFHVGKAFDSIMNITAALGESMSVEMMEMWEKLELQVTAFYTLLSKRLDSKNFLVPRMADMLDDLVTSTHVNTTKIYLFKEMMRQRENNDFCLEWISELPF